MKNNYTKFLTVLVLLIGINFGYSQAKLSESNFNTTVSDYLSQVKKNYNLTENDISDLYVTNEVYSKSTKITNLYINQQYQGIKIFNAISSVAVKDGKVFYFANNFTNNLNLKVNTTTPVINAQQAILRAAVNFQLTGVSGLDEISSEGHTVLFSNGNISASNIPVELMLTPTENGTIRLSWDLSINTLDGKHWWSVRVDAVTGNIINFNDWVVSCNFDMDEVHSNHSSAMHSQRDATFKLFKKNSMFADGSQYNVYALPTESPSFGARTLVSDPANDLASPFGWHDTNAAAGAEFTYTRGNNVWAQEDRNANGGIGYSPNGTATLNFDFPLNLAQAPADYQDASLTNLFYWNNLMHDVWYQYGFDEASGNFQQNNYGNGGTGNDFVSAEGQDGGSLNNANFGTPPEGSSPRMQMYLWSEPVLKKLVTVNTGTIAGQYTAVNPATGVGNNIPGVTATPVTANLVLVSDGTAAPTEGCSPLTNGASVAGKIALIQRGTCPFVDKIQNAQNAGAIGVIMMNHNNPTNDPAYVPYVNMAGMTTPAFTIPSVFVNYADGQILANALLNGETLNVTLQDQAVFQLDGSLDGGVMSHEYGHGISSRLTGGAFNTSCLTNPEQMGEGWSDFFALMMTIKPGDTGDVGRAIATYVSAQDPDGPGIRPAKYSTSFADNDFTYGATNDHTLLGTDTNGDPVYWNEVPHNIGFVWATMLWDLNWAYIEKYGFDPDIYNGTGGNNKVMQLVIDGLKLQPCGPGFVNGRDALLAADQATTGGEDQCLIWEVFANRGLGVNASQGTTFNMEDQVEDFNMPPSTDPTLANCTFLSLDDNEINEYKIYPNPTNNQINIRVNKNYGKVAITLMDINGRSVYNQNTILSDTVTINFGDLQAGMYILNISGDNVTINEKIIVK